MRVTHGTSLAPRVFFLLLLIWISQAVDLRKVTCRPYFGSWDCWYNQTCGDELYQCNGEANDAPSFSAIAFSWILVGAIGGIVIVIAIIVMIVLCTLKGWRIPWR